MAIDSTTLSEANDVLISIADCMTIAVYIVESNDALVEPFQLISRIIQRPQLAPKQTLHIIASVSKVLLDIKVISSE
jgi:hypothetical protein